MSNSQWHNDQAEGERAQAAHIKRKALMETVAILALRLRRAVVMAKRAEGTSTYPRTKRELASARAALYAACDLVIEFDELRGAEDDLPWVPSGVADNTRDMLRAMRERGEKGGEG